MSPADASCTVCGRSDGILFRFVDAGERATVRCLRHAAFYRPVFRRALRVAAIVGTILFVINQADVVLRGEATPAVVAKIALTYLVPFSVSTYSALAVNRVREGRQ